MIYTFVLKKDGEPRSIWNGHKKLPAEVVQHQLTYTQLIAKLKEFGYTPITY